MGSGSSRMGPRRPSPRIGLSHFICGRGAASSAAVVPPQVENEAPSKSLFPSRLHDSVLADTLQSSLKEPLLNYSSVSMPSSSTDELMRSRLSSNCGIKDKSTKFRTAESSDFGKHYSLSRELVPCLPASGEDITHPEGTCDLASTSTKTDHPEPPFAMLETSLVPVFVADDSTNDYSPQFSPVRFSSSIPLLESGDMPANVVSSSENPSNEVFGVQGSDSSSSAAVSTASTSWSMLGEEPLLGVTPPGSEFLLSNVPGERRNETILHVDVVSISSNTLHSGTGDTSNHEARNSRRLFWDAFSRRGSRRNDDHAAVLLTEDAEDLGSHNGSILDISDDLFENDLISIRRRRHGFSGRSWHSRSEIRDQFRGASNGSGGQADFCPSGLHPDGTCSCDSLLMAAESSTRASISRIVLLAEALFEVLDEIHRQPVPLSLSVVSLPAPESVVDSLPLKHHSKIDSLESLDDVKQCHICLTEYDEGDSIRVLPCRHEYHMSCVDKWLKEIRGVCPLCRGDVCEGVTEESTSNL